MRCSYGSVRNNSSKTNYISKRNENVCPPKNLYNNGYSSLIHTSQSGKEPKYPSMNEHNGVYLYNKLLFVHKRNEVLIPTTWMNLENLMLREKSHSQKTT